MDHIYGQIKDMKSRGGGEEEGRGGGGEGRGGEGEGRGGGGEGGGGREGGEGRGGGGEGEVLLVWCCDIGNALALTLLDSRLIILTSYLLQQIIFGKTDCCFHPRRNKRGFDRT